MPDPRFTTYRAAQRTSRHLRTLFDKLGNSEHPRGRILTAYRRTHRELRDIYRRQAPQWELREALYGLQRDITLIASEMLNEAAEIGAEQARVEARAWGLTPAPLTATTVEQLTAWAGVVEQQSVRALATVDPALVLGDETRMGILTPAPVVRDGAHWIATVLGMALASVLDEPLAATETRWGKQAIAAIDERTTDCCLQVHGQVVKFDGKFHLTGTPRFADNMDWSPFHWNCRTSVASVPLEEAEDDLTQRMRRESERERQKRQDARDRILEIQEELAKLGTSPDSRARADDTEEIKALRKEMLELRQRGGYGEVD